MIGKIIEKIAYYEGKKEVLVANINRKCPYTDYFSEVELIKTNAKLYKYKAKLKWMQNK